MYLLSRLCAVYTDLYITVVLTNFVSHCHSISARGIGRTRNCCGIAVTPIFQHKVSQKTLRMLHVICLACTMESIPSDSCAVCPTGKRV